MITYHALPTDLVEDWRNDAHDIHDQRAERAYSTGTGAPCRHCLRDVPEGREMLILAHRPFPSLHPYAEAGPIFVCADTCPRGGGSERPAILATSPDYLIKAYCDRDRIIYGTGAVVPAAEIEPYAHDLLHRPDVAYVHVRSARNNCYLCRIDRDT